MKRRGSWHDAMLDAAEPWPAGRPIRTELDAERRRIQLAATGERLATALRTETTAVTFHVWLRHLELVDATADTLYVTAPEHVRTWVRQRYGQTLDRLAAALAGRPIRVEVVDPRSSPPPAARTSRPPGGATEEDTHG